MRIGRAEVDAVDVERLRPFVSAPVEFYAPAGREHYRLLAYLSTFFNRRTIIDVGTHHGDSAAALSYEPTNKIESFDVVRKATKKPDNVTYHIADLTDPEARRGWAEMLLASALIFIDIDPHEGSRELAFVAWLKEAGYGGIIVLDDVWHFKGMRDNLWFQIEERFRTDATRIGHWSGTGIVSFASEIEVEEPKKNLDHWTLVTAYFDLTKMPDASPQIKARSSAHYLEQHAQGTLCLDKNLIVFCEPENKDRVMAIRPRRLHDKTRVVTMSFEDMPLTKHRGRIIENRGGPWCPSDPRNTASYYLLCMARYAMLKQAIRTNPFESTHFGWINVCIERMGPQNIMRLDEALAIDRERFSTCFIDYVPRSVVEDLPTYFNGDRCLGRCSMCSGFFTGSAHYMKEACDEIEHEFTRCLEAGYGHADEQLFSRVYFRRPELFDWYLGDYSEMITNYTRVYEHPDKPFVNLIRNSYRAGDREVCGRACRILLESHSSGACGLDERTLDEVRTLVDVCGMKA